MASDIGHALRDARHRRGVTLSDAARATGVRETHLAALERDDLESYGIDPVYVGGIVRTYADYLELDSVALLARYRADEPPAGRVRAAGASRSAPRAAADPGSQRDRRRSRRLSAVAVLVLLVVAAGAAAAVITLRAERVDGVPTAAVEQAAADAGADPSEAPATEAPSPAAAASVPAQSLVAPQRPVPDGLTMKLEFTRKVWVRVLADGRNVAEGIMRPGAVAQFTADEVIELRLGVPDAVEFSLNGAWYGAVGTGRSGPIDITCTTASSCDVVDAE